MKEIKERVDKYIKDVLGKDTLGRRKDFWEMNLKFYPKTGELIWRRGDERRQNGRVIMSERVEEVREERKLADGSVIKKQWRREERTISTKEKIGIGAAGIVGGIVLIGASGYLAYRCYQNDRRREESIKMIMPA